MGHRLPAGIVEHPGFLRKPGEQFPVARKAVRRFKVGNLVLKEPVRRGKYIVGQRSVHLLSNPLGILPFVEENRQKLAPHKRANRLEPLAVHHVIGDFTPGGIHGREEEEPAVYHAVVVLRRRIDIDSITKEVFVVFQS